ncbi:hypothetical protein HY412_01260 [Candidatus Kaiserbacteria bacterium]|nr:hypothetical protein [Candidatus Kaiserbacteria bacterium]
MTRCIIVGPDQARDVVRQLVKTGIQAKFISSQADRRILSTCQRESMLEAVAVFTSSSYGGNIKFLSDLRKAVSSSVKIHAIKKGGESSAPTNEELFTVPVNEVFSTISPSTSAIVAFIVQKLFRGENLSQIGIESTSAGAIVKRVCPTRLPFGGRTALEKAMSRLVDSGTSKKG